MDGGWWIDGWGWVWGMLGEIIIIIFILIIIIMIVMIRLRDICTKVGRDYSSSLFSLWAVSALSLGLDWGRYLRRII